jgi:hypothetical protein
MKFNERNFRVIRSFTHITNIHLPSLIDISPIAQVALLHTDINSGFKFCPRIGRKSAAKKKKKK